MSKRDLITLRKELEDNYIPQVKQLEVEISTLTRTLAISPDDLEPLLNSFKKLDSYVNYLRDVIVSGIVSKSHFITIYLSTRSLIKGFWKVIDSLNQEDSENPLLKVYQDKLSLQLPNWLFMQEINRWYNYPYSHKNYKRWVKRGWIVKTFEPFNEITVRLNKVKEELREFI